MTIPLKGDIKYFIRSYTEIINFFFSLRPLEKNVLYTLLLLYYQNKNNPKVQEMLFSRPVLDNVATSLKISHQSLANIKMSLKKKKVLIDNEDILIINPIITKGLPTDNKAKECEISFKFIIE